MANKKLIWNYSPVTKELLFESEAVESPREPGVYIFPAFSTDIKPPSTKKENTIPVFNEDTHKWKLESDYRNTDVYSKETGEKVEITEIGPLPKNLTTIKKPGAHYTWDEETENWIENKNIIVEEKLQANKELYESRKEDDVEFEGSQYSIDLLPEIAIALSLETFPKTFTLLDSNMELNEFNKERLQGLAAAFQNRNQKLNKTFIAKKRKIEGA